MRALLHRYTNCPARTDTQGHWRKQRRRNGVFTATDLNPQHAEDIDRETGLMAKHVRIEPGALALLLGSLGAFCHEKNGGSEKMHFAKPSWWKSYEFSTSLFF